jgi:2-polyprenyl-3-methyl-5-hydroxy-6-metoxy-1,4-benzoquinol methylase
MFVQVSYEIGDVMHHEFEPNSFDVIYSRDTILHIADKMTLFSRLYVRLIYKKKKIYFIAYNSIELAETWWTIIY